MPRAKKEKKEPKPEVVVLRAFSHDVKRWDAEHGHLYETPGGNFWGATTYIGVVDKPAIKYWYASKERAHVIEAAAQIWADAPKDWTRLRFVTALQERTKGIKAAQKELEKAQEIGTQAHALVEWELRRELGLFVSDRPKAREEAEWSLESWHTWRASVELEPLWIEQVVYSKEHEYAGTTDLIARLHLKDERHDYGRTLATIDWKTGKRHYPESSMQAAAYAWALHEMGHAPEGPPPGLVIRLPKLKGDPGFDPKVVHTADFSANFEAFLNAQGLWWWLQGEEERMAKFVPPPPPAPAKVEDLVAEAIAIGVQGAPF